MATATETAAERAKDITTKAIESVRDAAGNVIDQAKQVGGNALNAVDAGADRVTETVSGGLKSTARTIRESGPQDGRLGDVTSAVAQTFSNSANYLDRQGLNGMVEDLSGLIAKNPIPALLTGIGLGYLIGSVTRRS